MYVFENIWEKYTEHEKSAKYMKTNSSQTPVDKYAIYSNILYLYIVLYYFYILCNVLS